MVEARRVLRAYVNTLMHVSRHTRAKEKRHTRETKKKKVKPWRGGSARISSSTVCGKVSEEYEASIVFPLRPYLARGKIYRITI